MPKRIPDYDNVFKTMKSKHKRLFISVINDVFEKNYAMDTKIEILPSEGYLTENETIDGSKDIKEQISDFVIKIENEERLVNIMGGTVIETESEKLIRKGIAEGKAEEIIEMGQEFGLDETAILKKLQEKIGVSLETATAYLEQYGKQFI